MAAALNDDMVTEILLRLPSLSVLRFRAVCKAWRAISSSPSFVAAHSRLRPPELIMQRSLLLHDGSMLDTIPLATLDDDAERRCLDPGYQFAGLGEEDIPPGSGYSLIACCDGLLLLELARGVSLPRYLVCNPVTRQWTAVPLPAPANRLTLPCGFYLHRPSGQHRILFLTNDDDGRSASYYVRSLEDAQTRRLGQAAAAVHLMSTAFIGCGGDLHGHRGGRFIHWLRYYLHEPEANNILAFDTVSETFRRISPPPVTDLPVYLSLLEMDGMLAMMATLHDGLINIWVLEDYDDDRTWTPRLRIQLPPTLTHAHWALQGAQGHILLIGGYRSLGLYDITRKELLKQIPLHNPYAHGFRDSLQRHAFFQLQN